MFLSKPPRTILLGGEFEFNCTFEDSSQPLQIFNWFHNNSLIRHADYWKNLRIKTVMNSEWSTILVTSAQREDGGEYWCEAVFTTTYERSKRYTVQILGILV